MRRFLLTRLVLLIPVVLGVVTFVFFILHLIPGDPADMILGEAARAVDRQQLRHELGLDRPLLVQYGAYLGGLLRGRLGFSYRSSQPVGRLISQRYPATLLLSGAALLVAVAIALPCGIFAATRHHSPWDRTSMVVALLGVSVPNFWLGPLLIILFSVRLGWLPVSGTGGLSHLILPALTLGTGLAALLTRMTRSTMLEALGEEFIQTARSKGLQEWTVLWKHALRNAAIPLITVVGLQSGALLSGSIITESIFAWPGLGRLIIQAIEGRDYPVVQGCVLVFALTFVGINLVVDLLYAAADPRVKFAQQG